MLNPSIHYTPGSCLMNLDAAHSEIKAFIHSRLDYCNSATAVSRCARKQVSNSRKYMTTIYIQYIQYIHQSISAINPEEVSH